MNYDRILIFFVLILLLASFVFSAGCTSSKADSCNRTLSEINYLENLANDRVKSMDFSNPDDFFDAQAEASKKQYSDALFILTNSGVKDCMTDIKYNNWVRSLQLKYLFLDMYLRVSEFEERYSALSDNGYSEYQKSLKVVINQLDEYLYETKYLQIMADDIEPSLLDVESQDVLDIIRNDLADSVWNLEDLISVLIPYQ